MGDCEEKITLSALFQNKIMEVSDHVFYIPDYISQQDEKTYLDKVYQAPKPKWTVLKERRLQNWGGLPSQVTGKMMQEPLPAWLSGLSKAIHSTLLAPAQEGLVESSLQLFSEFNHVLVNEYLPGQGIFAHEDGPFYHPMVATLSLGSHTIINYRPKHSALETDPSLKGFFALHRTSKLSGDV
ncbi:Alpha-ketoglutarate-dependent dioxygenase alkB 6 [Entomophthora muscae]|uniref:Alpha-ketoglutarate-dependent dioxygenase alkB 6 n=1 Tax=Entomophthora muscae TaxID=34485 RepID=A0ACC2UID6_9FUNG|nr:Alpha-ketoglutarate-dependent dioxygenase alkB 6 [Entomophthora muscae]